MAYFSCCPVEFINTIGIAVSGFMAMYVLQRPQKSLSDFFIVLLNLIVVFYLANEIWIHRENTVVNLTIGIIIPYSIFPIYILYGLLLLQKAPKFRWQWSFLFIPAGVISISVVAHLLFTDTEPLASLQQMYYDPDVPTLVIYKGYDVFNLVVAFWFMGKLKRYRNDMERWYSDMEPVRFQWLRSFTWGFFSLNLVATVVFVLYNFGQFPSIIWPYTILNSFVVAVLAYLNIKGIQTFSEEAVLGAERRVKEMEKDREIKVKEKPKYESSSMSSADMEAFFGRLKDLFEREKIFLEPRLQLVEVAEKLGEKPHKISQTLNMHGGLRFHQFVNQYRVEYLKALLRDPANRHLTILALGLDSGFNSKASLNRIFKQITGISPRAYQEAQQPEPVTP